MDEPNRLFRAASGEHDPARCEDCRDKLAAFVEAEMAGKDAAALFPEVQEHLDTCEDCEAEYAALLDLAMAEDGGLLPQADDINPPDLSFLTAAALPTYVRGLARKLAQVFSPSVLPELEELFDPFLERVKALGEQPLPAMTATLGAGQDALRVLATTYAVTQDIVRRYSVEELEAQQAQSTLTLTLRDRAAQEALRQGFQPSQAQSFADVYAETVSHEAHLLQTLAVQQRGK